MNERIRDLANQASEYASNYDIGSPMWMNFYNEKFAELIIKECAKVAFDDWCKGIIESSSEMAILKHFGVGDE